MFLVEESPTQKSRNMSDNNSISSQETQKVFMVFLNLKKERFELFVSF